jgi:tRNA nucleotidyltransferase (CCA-adding enzyme)
MPTQKGRDVKTYLVGGAVRDTLLGLSGSDRDWVVVGATPEQMVARGFVPVGKDFPVFLHPDTKEEYALARTERKTAPGYKGFVVHASPDVTLEQDLARRDLTINAMAQDPERPSTIVDPYRGQTDLQRRVLRHVTDAFREDPVRILRLARFAARLGDFEVAPETLTLARDMVQAGEVDALVPERVWQELERGLMAGHPSRMAQVLWDCGAWPRLWPELDWHAPNRVRLWQWLDSNTHGGSALGLGQRWALWCHGAAPGQVSAIGERLRVPQAVNELALGWAIWGSGLQEALPDAPSACERLHRMDAQRRPERVQEWLHLAHVASWDSRQVEHAQSWQKALRAMQGVDVKATHQRAVEQGLRGPAIGRALVQAQSEAIAQALNG